MIAPTVGRCSYRAGGLPRCRDPPTAALRRIAARQLSAPRRERAVVNYPRLLRSRQKRGLNARSQTCVGSRGGPGLQGGVVPDRYPAIEDHAVVGDLHTVALGNFPQTFSP